MTTSRPSKFVEHAPAKVNLTLAVLGRRADGYHLLDSLVVFARAGDRLSFAPGKALSLNVRGAHRQAGRSRLTTISCSRRRMRLRPKSPI